jgi:hypothetical protein
MKYIKFDILDCNRNKIDEGNFKNFEYAVFKLPESLKDGIYYVTDNMHEIKVTIEKSLIIKKRIKSYKFRNYIIKIIGNNICSIENHISKTTFNFSINNFEEKFKEHKIMLDSIEGKILLTFEQQIAIKTALQALKDVGDYTEEDYKEEIKELNNLLNYKY